MTPRPSASPSLAEHLKSVTGILQIASLIITLALSVAGSLWANRMYAADALAEHETYDQQTYLTQEEANRQNASLEEELQGIQTRLDIIAEGISAIQGELKARF